VTIACVLARGGAGVIVCRTGLRILLYGRILSLAYILTLTFLLMNNQPLQSFQLFLHYNLNRDNVGLSIAAVAKITNPAF
jgi:hypothetical protein